MDSCFALLVGVCVSFVLSLCEVLARLRVGVCVPLAKFNFVLFFVVHFCLKRGQELKSLAAVHLYQNLP